MAGIGIPIEKFKKNSGAKLANFWAEATRDKEHLDPDIDPEKTKLNIWRMGSPDESFVKIAKDYAAQQKDAQGRGVRSDAVIAMNAIIKPTESYINGMSMDEQIKFLDIAVDKFIDMQGRDRFKEGRAAIVYHFDEQGAHAHLFWLPIVYDKKLEREKLCAKECCGKKWLNDVNRKFPEFLRSKGYEIEDADCWDDNMTPEQAQELIERRKNKKSGRTSHQYKTEQDKLNKYKAKQMEAIETDLQDHKAEQLKTINTEIQKAIDEAEPKLSALENRVEFISQKADQLSRVKLDAEDVPKESQKFIFWCMNHLKGVQEYIESYCREMYQKFWEKQEAGKNEATEKVFKQVDNVASKIAAARNVLEEHPKKDKSKNDIERGGR